MLSFAAGANNSRQIRNAKKVQQPRPGWRKHDSESAALAATRRLFSRGGNRDGALFARAELSLVLGEVHHPRKQIPSENPRWLTIPERGLFTGIAIVGAVGSGKTASCMYPFAEQILAFHADDPERRVGGLILEVKGDF